VPKDRARPLGGRRRNEATALPGWIKPQLTKLVDRPPDGPEWLHEIKFDGYRMHARLDGGAVRLLTRTGLDWTHKYSGIAAAVASLPARQAYLDGELCGVRPDGTTSFKPGAGQQPDRTPVQPGMHPVAVEFDFVQPLRPIGRLVHEFGELRFDPAGERRRLAATLSAERSRHVFGHARYRGSVRPGFTR
jgi:ATP dependent DNA ligase domain